MAKNAQRKLHRSGKQKCAICEAEIPLVKHHINGREIRQAEAEWNICWICPNCHDAVHTGDIVIEKWATTTDGRMLFWRSKDEEPLVSSGATVKHYV